MSTTSDLSNEQPTHRHDEIEYVEVEYHLRYGSGFFQGDTPRRAVLNDCGTRGFTLVSTVNYTDKHNETYLVDTFMRNKRR